VPTAQIHKRTRHTESLHLLRPIHMNKPNKNNPHCLRQLYDTSTSKRSKLVEESKAHSNPRHDNQPSWLKMNRLFFGKLSKQQLRGGDLSREPLNNGRFCDDSNFVNPKASFLAHSVWFIDQFLSRICLFGKFRTD